MSRIKGTRDYRRVSFNKQRLTRGFNVHNGIYSVKHSELALRRCYFADLIAEVYEARATNSVSKHIFGFPELIGI